MNARFLPGGDKWHSIREDERRSYHEIKMEDCERYIDGLKSHVSTWTENEIEMMNTPFFEKFIDEYPEYDHEELHATIHKEMERVKALCRKDAIANTAYGQGSLSAENLKEVEGS